MVQVSSSPLILEIVAMKNIMQVLERLGESLGKLQKALGDYLERQRSGFSRFYFVGDEDLLEMIGNGRDPVQVHACVVSTCDLVCP
jgi:dynein heavy chain 1